MITLRSFVCVSCVFRIVRVKRSFVLFAFFVRLRLVRIVSLYDPGSIGYILEITALKQRQKVAMMCFIYVTRLLYLKGTDRYPNSEISHVKTWCRLTDFFNIRHLPK